MIFKSKYFNELSVYELYEILHSRYEVFTLEQKIYYQDMDGLDCIAKHFFIEDCGKVVAYLRAFPLSDNSVKIGRVLTTQRKAGLGRQLMEKSLDDIISSFKCSEIHLDSQIHALGFYNLFGFKTTTEEFMEAGIPHKSMILELK